MREDKRVNQPLVVGDVIELIYMDDPYNPISPLTRGVVMGFEPTPGMDKILVRWIIDADNEEFRNMPMIPEADIWRKITPTVKENTKMKKIKLTENTLKRIVKRVIFEQEKEDANKKLMALFQQKSEGDPKAEKQIKDLLLKNPHLKPLLGAMTDKGKKELNQ
jgi:hypothetical protein|tara:strand:+ start:793 stop:1281 length:489 start_codon:yes stop_codon:yes gene_type:complete